MILGVCFAEIVWPTDEVAAILVKNCLGRVTFVAFDFGSRCLASAEPYRDLMANVIRSKYLNKAIPESDPFRWINTREASEAYGLRRGRSNNRN